jgi:Zn-dependent peptidase ImmA (M78 family)/predicted secreted protein
MNIREAKLCGVRAAAEVHEKLGILAQVRNGLKQIDIFAAINDLGVPVICRPLEGLLGAYFNKPTHGIMVTTNRRLAIQRFTAAHELGHYWLNHAESFDDEETLSLARQGVASIPLQEVEAESFASEFLLPKLLIFKAMERQRWNKLDLKRPSIVYQLSLRLGASYEATWRALLDCNFITSETANHLNSVPPKVSKKDVLQGYQVADPWSDAFYVTASDNLSVLNANQDDTVVLELPEHYSSGYRWTATKDSEDTQIISNELIQQHEGQIGGIATRKIYLKGRSIAHICLEEKRPWQAEGKPLKTFELSVDFSGKEIGIPRSIKNATKI